MTSLLALLQSSTRLRPEYAEIKNYDPLEINKLPNGKKYVFVAPLGAAKNISYFTDDFWVTELVPTDLKKYKFKESSPLHLWCLSLTPAQFKAHPGCLEAFAALPGRKMLALLEWNEALPFLGTVLWKECDQCGGKKGHDDFSEWWACSACMDDDGNPTGSIPRKALSLLLLSGPSAADKVKSECLSCYGVGTTKFSECCRMCGGSPSRPGRGWVWESVPPLSVEVAREARDLCREAGVDFALDWGFKVPDQDYQPPIYETMTQAFKGPRLHLLDGVPHTPYFPPKEEGV